MVSTPIGNLSDITLRALNIIAASDILICEDTRVTRVLLNHYSILKNPISYHDHSSYRKELFIINALTKKKSVALVSDSGTPIISDPGFSLVNMARKKNFPIIPIPGPSSILTALTPTGFPAHNFFFSGFISKKKSSRKKHLIYLKSLNTTFIFYDSPYRVCSTLVDMQEIFGKDCIIAMCRELTKKFEEIFIDTIEVLLKKYSNNIRPKGEIVIVVNNTKKSF